MSRQLRTRFSALRFTDIKQQVKVFQDNMEQIPKFKQNDAVFTKNVGKGQDWMPGIVTDVISPKSFLVQVKDVVQKRHVDQLKPRQIPEGQSSSCDVSIEVTKRMDKSTGGEFKGETNKHIRTTNRYEGQINKI